MPPNLFEQIDSWERAVARDERLRRLVPLEDDVSTLSLPAAAEAAALEQSSFSRYFRQVVGVPFRRWRAALRVSRALQLLRSSDATVEEIAREVGYADARSLRRAMKQHLGAGPAAMRAATDRTAGRSRRHANDA